VTPLNGIRLFAVSLAFLAAAFGLLFLMSLSRPEHFGSLSMWLPLVFAASVFIGAFLIGQWGAAIAARESAETPLGALPGQPAHDAEEEDPEPVRLGAVLPSQSAQ
jgi:hypothetical protein